MPKYTLYTWLKGCAEIEVEARSGAEAQEIVYANGMMGREFGKAFQEVVWDWEIVDTYREGQPYNDDDEHYECEECGWAFALGDEDDIDNKHQIEPNLCAKCVIAIEREALKVSSSVKD